MSDIYLTGKLNTAQILEAMRALPLFFREYFGECVLQAMYGTGSHLHPGLQYAPMEVGTAWAEKFIEDSLDKKIVEPGKSDFIFEVPNQRLIVTFCHEGDIHSEGTDLESQRQLWLRQPFRDLPLCKSPSEQRL